MKEPTGISIDLLGRGRILNDSSNTYLVKLIDPLRRVIGEYYLPPWGEISMMLNSHVLHHISIMKI